MIQPQLTVNAPGDRYEREADTVADRIMRMPNGAALTQPSLTPVQHIQRKCAACEEDENLLQRKEQNSGAIASPTIASQLAGSQGRGRPLPGTTQGFMGRAIGADFSGVRVHTDGTAAQMNQQLNARAFTYGSDIYFNQKEYDPDSAPGKRLLGHELAHVVQQGADKITPRIQREFSIEPTVPEAVANPLTPDQQTRAKQYNETLFTDAAEIEVIRDVIGISKTPAIIDDDFNNSIAQYQASFGLNQDGILGPVTAGRLAQELTAEADFLSQPAQGTSLRRTARRLLLRSMVPRRQGTIAHQGFTGPDDRASGVITVRLNANESALTAAANRAITLDYTGDGANNVNWLQFVSREMYGFQPGSSARVNNTGNVVTTGGSYAYSTPGSRTWNLDTATGSASPFYNSGFLSVRTPNRSLVMIDQPGSASNGDVATFAASTAPNLDRVRVKITFDAYAVRNNNVIYRVRWSGFYTINPTTFVSSNIAYSIGFTGSVSRILSAQRAVLNTRFPTNTIR